MKKRSIAGAVAVTLTVLAVPAVAFANGGSELAPQESSIAQYDAVVAPALGEVVAQAASESNVAATVGAGFVGSDADGLCDNYDGGNGNGAGYLDENSDGICDNYGNGNGNGNGGNGGNGYVDADNDGVCDNYGARNADGNGAGNGAGYADENNDGICDNYGNGAGQGNGGGRHGRGC